MDDSPHVKRCIWSWSTSTGVWTATSGKLNPNFINPGLSIAGPGGVIDLGWAGFDDAVRLLRGVGALPALGDLAPPNDGTASVIAEASPSELHAFVSLLTPHLPAHACIRGNPTAGPNRQEVIITIAKAFTPASPWWSATWTTPAGKFGVEVNPRDPNFRGTVITTPGGNWRMDGPLDHFRTVSVLRGVAAIEMPAEPAVNVESVGVTDQMAEAIARTAERRERLGDMRDFERLVVGRAAKMRDSMAGVTVTRPTAAGMWIDLDTASRIAGELWAREVRDRDVIRNIRRSAV